MSTHPANQAVHRQPTVFLIDDDVVVLNAIGQFVTSTGLLVETFQSAQDFLDGYDCHRPGCIVTDLRMPAMSGVQLLTELVARRNISPVIVLTGFGHLSDCIAAVHLGVFEILEKPVAPEQLLECIEHAIACDVQNRRVCDALERLTLRERDVMDRLVTGHSIKQVARNLNVSFQTVAKHRLRVFEKFDVHSEVELVHLILGTTSQLTVAPTASVIPKPHLLTASSSAWQKISQVHGHEFRGPG